MEFNSTSIPSIDTNPQNPFFYSPVMAGYLCLMVVLYFITALVKSKSSSQALGDRKNSFLQETLNPSVIYAESIVEKKNSLRARYLIAFILTRASMWAKSPYIYSLFSTVHNLSLSEIGVLYVVDAVSALISGPIIGNLADMYGRKFFCMLYCLTTAVNLVIRGYGSVFMLYSAQILTGIGAGLINTTFESWVNAEARKEFEDSSVNPEESNKAMERFLKKLFKTQNILDAVMSIVVSLICAILFTYYGIFAPITISTVLTLLSFVTIYFLWNENTPNADAKNNVGKSIKDALSELKKREVLSVGIMESLFLAVNSLFMFAWTPILTNSIDKPINVGVIFICFVMAMITGTMLYEIVIIYMQIDNFKAIVAFFFFQVSVFTTIYLYDSFLIRLVMLSFINGCIGFYSPLNSIIKTKILEEKYRALLMNIFRIPLNIYVIAVLLFLKYINPFTICLIAAGMLCVAFLIAVSLVIWRPKLKNKTI